MPSPLRWDYDPVDFTLPPPTTEPSFADEVADQVSGIQAAVDATHVSISESQAQRAWNEGRLAELTGVFGELSSTIAVIPTIEPAHVDSTSVSSLALNAGLDDFTLNNAERTRIENRQRRAWRSMINRDRGPELLNISPIFCFPPGPSGQSKGTILVSKGANGYGWVTGVSRLFSRNSALDHNKQALLSSFLTERTLIDLLAERRRRLAPNAAVRVVSTRGYEESFRRAWQVKLESFRDGLDWFGTAGDCRGHAWMVDEEVQVQLEAVKIDRPFMIVAQDGVESVVCVPERYHARIDPIIISSTMRPVEHASPEWMENTFGIVDWSRRFT